MSLFFSFSQKILPSPEDFPLCFSDTDNDKEYVYIGHLRGDFGSRQEFWED